MTSINYPSYAENTNTDNFQVVGYNETTQAVERKNLGSAIDAKIVASSGAVQSAFQLIPQLIFKWTDDNNNPANGWLITSYEAGTTTKIDTYSDDIGTVNDNPITLDPRGEARIFLDSTLVYKFVITDALGGNVQTFDNITGVGGVSSGGGGSVAGNVGDLQLNKDGVNFGASGLNWSGGVLLIDNNGVGTFTQDFSDLSKVTTTTTYDTGSAVQVVQSGAVSTTLTGSAGALALVSDATRQSITMDNVSITSDAQSVFGLGVTLGGGLGLVDGSVDYTSGVFRFRENGVTRGFNAVSITYDNSVSGLVATDVKSAIDELNANANTLTMETITTSETNTALVAKPDGVGGVTWGTDSALPAGSTTEIQVNVGGVFGAYSAFTFDGAVMKVPQIGSSLYADYTDNIYSKQIRLDNANTTLNDTLLNVFQNDNTRSVDVALLSANNQGRVLVVAQSDVSNAADAFTVTHNGLGNGIYSSTLLGGYSIYATGGSTASIYAENGIVSGDAITQTNGFSLSYTTNLSSITPYKASVGSTSSELKFDHNLNTWEFEPNVGIVGALNVISNITTLGNVGAVDGNFSGDLDVTGSGTFDNTVFSDTNSTNFIANTPSATGSPLIRLNQNDVEKGYIQYRNATGSIRLVATSGIDVELWGGDAQTMTAKSNGSVSIDRAITSASASNNSFFRDSGRSNKLSYKGVAGGITIIEA